MAVPNTAGVYEFDLMVEHSLPMSVRRDGKVIPVDYLPDKKVWRPRGANRTLTAEEIEELLQWDGLHRRIVTIDGESPGRVIVVPLGARVAMRVRNRLRAEALTIHLHGMDKKNAWWTDGVAFVQQCPIQPQTDFVYRFIADTPGTHWYHEEGGGGGPIKFELDGETATIGREYYSILQDWSVPSSAEQWLCHIHSTMKWLYGFDQVASNDARHECWAPKRTYDSQKGWHSQADIRQRPSALPLTTYAIRKGENVLLRLVNGGVSQGFMVWVEQHEFWVTAADGAPVKPIRLDALILFPGERYDLLIRGLKTPRRRVYRVIVETMEYINWDWTRMDGPAVGLANLHYEDAYTQKAVDEDANAVDWTHRQCTPEAKCIVLNCPFKQFPPHFNFTCMPVHLLENAESIEDIELLEQKVFPDGTFHEVFANMHSDNHFDGWLFKHPLGIPYFNSHNLSRVAHLCDTNTSCDPQSMAHWDHSCDCFVHFNFKLDSVVQITIYNMGEMDNPFGPGYSHPLHVHGTHFLLVKVGYGGYHANNGSIWTMNPDIPCTNDRERCVGLKWANTSWLGGNVPAMRQRPSSRDTVNIPVGGYITIR
uniref:Multicopper oxidase n=1 Tax=Globodera pallida TaxID=36090 RepID=A0A183CEP1_GLOPA